MSSRVLFALAAMCLLVTPLAASDGRFEINQVCASFTSGCFPGDTQGFPITITQPGSYVLTSNLVTPNVNTTTIRVQAPNVTINLNGFSITGPVTCTGSATVSCSPGSGTGRGIEVQDHPNIRIHNGSIRGMGQHGIWTSGVRGLQIHDLTITNNRESGILSTGFGVIHDVTIQNNGGVGISAVLSGIHVRDSHVTLNGGLAVQAVSCSNNFFHRQSASAISDIMSCPNSFGNNRCISGSIITTTPGTC